MREGSTVKYLLEGDLLMTRLDKLYVPINGLCMELLWETNVAKWVGYSSEERTLALMVRCSYWPKTGEDVHAYAWSCLVCH